MMLFDIVYWALMSVLVINFASTWVWFVCVGFVNVVFRKEFDKLWLVRYKAERLSGHTCWEDVELVIPVSILIDGLIFLGLLGGVLTSGYLDGSDTLKLVIGYILIVSVASVVLMYLLRFLGDLTRNLKHNHKTGESVKLTEMDAKIKELESKLEKES